MRTDYAARRVWTRIVTSILERMLRPSLAEMYRLCEQRTERFIMLILEQNIVPPLLPFFVILYLPLNELTRPPTSYSPETTTTAKQRHILHEKHFLQTTYLCKETYFYEKAYFREEPYFCKNSHFFEGGIFPWIAEYFLTPRQASSAKCLCL